MKYKISVLIIDSDPISLSNTTQLLQANKKVSDIEITSNCIQALLKLIDFTPDVVLLEYPAPGEMGDTLIRLLKTRFTETTLVFISETKDYAIDAIRQRIFNYLLKPLQKAELYQLIQKIQSIKQENKLSKIKQIIEEARPELKFSIQSSRDHIIIDPEDILYCKSEGAYSEIFFTNERCELCYLSLNKFEEIFSRFKFIRISRAFLINTKYIRRVNRNTNTVVLFANGKEYETCSSKGMTKLLCNLELEL